MNLDDNLIKTILSISFDDFMQNKIGSIKTAVWEDRYFKNTDPHPHHRHCEKKNKKPITGMLLIGGDEKIQSKKILFRGLGLGPELFVHTYKINLFNGSHGLSIDLNLKAYFEGNLKKLIGPNPRTPESISLNYFGAEISRWHSKPNAWKFSIKFYDEFIKQSLTQDNLVTQIERRIDHVAQIERRIGHSFGDLGFRREIVHILRSINNFKTFLNDEMNIIKEKFNKFKKIETIIDCVNLLFIFSPLFKDVMEFEFKNYYIEHNANEYKQRYGTEIKNVL